MLNKPNSIVIGTILLTLFSAMVTSGLYVVNREQRCEPNVFCEKAWDYLGLALWSAVTSSVAGIICIWALRVSLIHRHTGFLVLIGAVCSALLFLLFPVALELRSIVATHFFPYIIALRFGDLGLFFVWGTLSLVVCATVMALMQRLNKNQGA